MPVHNGARFLATAIESVLSQDFTDFELIIADNGSTDETNEICWRYATQDDRIMIVRHPRNIGAAKNYNYAFHCASGRYFSWLACDDILHSGFLEACVTRLAGDSRRPILVYPNFEFIDEQGVTLTFPESSRSSPCATSLSPTERLRDTLDSRGFMTAVFGVFRRDMLKKTRLIGGFASSDHILLAECALLGPIIRLEGQPLFYRRLHPGRSRLANITAEEVAHWFDPDGAVPADEEKLLDKEYLRSVLNADGLSHSQRLSAVALLFARRSRRRTRRLKRRMKRFVPVSLKHRIKQISSAGRARDPGPSNEMEGF
jgi:glycosyltransferase involved in cell wall biosynthesis